MPERLRVVAMTEYRCPHCGFRWLQENAFPYEHCFQCDQPVEPGKIVTRAYPTN